MSSIANLNAERLSKLSGLELFLEQQRTVESQTIQLIERSSAMKNSSSLEELRQKVSVARSNKERRVAEAVSSYASFLQAAGSVAHECTIRLHAFQRAASYSSVEVRTGDVGGALPFVEGWVSFCDTTRAEVASLEQAAAKFGAADVSCIQDVKKCFADTSSAFSEVCSSISRENSRRRDYEMSVTQFKNDQAKLLHWCRQQRSTLEPLRDPQHIQEFCASFQANIGIMETNFLVLTEIAEPLLPNDDIQRLLMEITEVWLSLEVFSFEKLNATLLEKHLKSNFENQCKQWMEFSAPIKAFLQKAHDLLEMPADDESKALTLPLWKECDALLQTFDSHNIVVSHLCDFTLRDECLREYYTAIRRTVFSKLTLLTQTFTGKFNFEKKQDYTDRLAELTDWVECKSQSGAWRQLLARVDKMKHLIEENEALHGASEDRY